MIGSMIQSLIYLCFILSVQINELYNAIILITLIIIITSETLGNTVD